MSSVSWANEHRRPQDKRIPQEIPRPSVEGRSRSLIIPHKIVAPELPRRVSRMRRSLSQCRHRTALLDSTGTQVVKYTYDAWGKPTSKSGTMKNTLGTVQPFRYRGYVVDEETGLYYLRSRYYNPTGCRFINRDEIRQAASLCFAESIYAYCKNAPVVMVDNDGFDAQYFLNGAYYIGGYLVNKEEYEAYVCFLDVYRTAIGNSSAMLPALYENEGCFDIRSVSYTVERTHKSTLWESVCTLSGLIGDTAEALVPFVAMGSHYAAAFFLNTFVDPDMIADNLSTAIDFVTNAIGQIEIYFPYAGKGHSHTTHILRIKRNAIMKTTECFELDICQVGQCPTRLIHAVSTGWNAP